MALTPQQQLKRRMLLAKKELRDVSKTLNELLHFPLLLEHIQYETDVKEKPSELASAAKVQRVAIPCSPGLVDIDLFLTQEKPPSVSIYNAHLTNPDSVALFSADLAESNVLEVGLFRLACERVPVFRLIFSDMHTPVDPDSELIVDYRKNPLILNLSLAEMLLVVKSGDRVFRKYLNLAQLAADLDCLKGAE